MLVIIFLLHSFQIQAQVICSETATTNAFPLASANNNVCLYIDSNDTTVVKIASTLFVKDVFNATNQSIKIQSTTSINQKLAVVVGTIGHSALIDDLIQKKLINVSAINKGWEQFSITIINKPYQKANQLLVIAGCDRRGTAYGLMHLSRLIGVHPFTWWADIPAKKKNALFISGTFRSKQPSVQYRGIFLNDEDWGLQPWAAKNLDTLVKDIGPKTYEKIFELMLRLKANYIWPAMHPCTKAFYYYKQNPKLADDYAILVGGSHCEPMLRNNVFEWAENFEHEYGKKPGEWRYDVNEKEMYKYWDDRIIESKNFESVYTMGMRGIHDGSMPGPKDVNEKVKLLEKVITDQRTILATRLNKPLNEVPQIFVPYKEVLSLYQRGMNLPDDITIIWPDDNHGYIRQLPNDAESKRSGGNGVYYHLSYWGRPQDYLWLSTISSSLISFEMTKAYQFNAKKLWVFNVGDIKPAEAELQFAMDLAWDINSWKPQVAYKYTAHWAEEIFGKENAASITLIKNKYYELAASSKPEHLSKIKFTESEWHERIVQYQSIAHKAIEISKNIKEDLKDAFFELILYPIVSACLMNEKFAYAQQSIELAKQGKPEALLFSRKATAAFDSIAILTQQYHSAVANGKWNGMMSWHPRDLEVFKMPPVANEAMVHQSVQNPLLQTVSDTFLFADIHAVNFNKKENTTQANIITVKGLGDDGNSITAMPYSFQSINNNDAPVATCSIKLPEGKYLLQLHTVPVHSINKSTPIKINVAVNDNVYTTFNVEVPAETPEWDKAVMNGYVQRQLSFSTDGEKATTIKLQFITGSVVVSKIVLYSIK